MTERKRNLTAAVLTLATVATLSAVSAVAGVSDRFAWHTIHEGQLVGYYDACFVFDGGTTITTPDGWQFVGRGREPVVGCRYVVRERRTVLGSPIIVEEVEK